MYSPDAAVGLTEGRKVGGMAGLDFSFVGTHLPMLLHSQQGRLAEGMEGLHGASQLLLKSEFWS